MLMLIVCMHFRKINFVDAIDYENIFTTKKKFPDLQNLMAITH